jgi:hypothetical protein
MHFTLEEEYENKISFLDISISKDDNIIGERNQQILKGVVSSLLCSFKLLTTPLSICWFLSPIHGNARYNDQDDNIMFRKYRKRTASDDNIPNDSRHPQQTNWLQLTT